MVKFLVKPKCSASRRRMRTQAEWKVEIHIPRAVSPTIASTRSRISAAALLVNVIARIWLGHASRLASSPTTRRVSTLVLPEPAPATMSSDWPRYSTASRCCGFRPSSRGFGVAPSASRMKVISPPSLGATPDKQRWSDDLEQARRAHAAADAHRHDHVLGAATPALEQRVAGHPRPRHAVGVSDRDGAAVHVELLGVDAELVAAVEGLRGEGLVEFPQ